MITGAVLLFSLVAKLVECTNEVMVVTSTDQATSFKSQVIEVYDFASSTWRSVETTDSEASSTSRKFSYRTTAKRLPGRARIVEDNNVVEYTLSSGMARKLAEYPEEAEGVTVLEYGDTMCLVGGYDVRRRRARHSVHCWNPLAMQIESVGRKVESESKSSGWVALPELIVGRFRPGAVVMDGKMYVAGGKDPARHEDMSSMEIFDDVTQKWYMAGSMLTPRTGLQLVELRGKLYAMGGWTKYQFLRKITGILLTLP